MTRISILLYAISLAMACVACADPETPGEVRATSSLRVPPILPLFQRAIAARDEATTVFFGSVSPGRFPPSTVTITFYDDVGDELETLSELAVRELNDNIVYAMPAVPLSRTPQQNVKNASTATVTVGIEVQDIDLGQAMNTLLEFNVGYWPPAYSYDGYGGCPHCLTYFICNCLPVGPDLTARSLMCKYFPETEASPCAIPETLLIYR